MTSTSNAGPVSPQAEDRGAGLAGLAGMEEAPAAKAASPAEARQRAAFAKSAQAALGGLRKLSRHIRPRDWHCRYLTTLSLLHRRIFDRSIERLLFYKTPPLGAHTAPHPQDSSRKSFCYQGPIPRKVLAWALSALPGDLKRYAFVDFDAGNGRTLLLAAQHNFEHATGYASDAESCERVEMNLAQYSRSYMRCRDVRVLRGDREGVTIPQQPAVLFFPDSLAASHLGILLSHAAASQSLDPRPLYLIFENACRERALEQMQNFERVPLPILNRLKAHFFSPAKIAVYRSREGGTS